MTPQQFSLNTPISRLGRVLVHMIAYHTQNPRKLLGNQLGSVPKGRFLNCPTRLMRLGDYSRQGESEEAASIDRQRRLDHHVS